MTIQNNIARGKGAINCVTKHPPPTKQKQKYGK